MSDDMFDDGKTSRPVRDASQSPHKHINGGNGSPRGDKLLARLGGFCNLDARASAVVRSLYSSPRRTGRSQIIYPEGADNPSLYIVEDGWLIAERYLKDGRRQVLRTYVPGEIAGISEFARKRSSITLEVVESGIVYPVTAARFEQTVSASQSLSSALFGLMREEILALSDRVQAIGRMTARERLVFFILRHLERLRIVDPGVENSMNFPLSQTDIGDALGLTHTYVSKIMRELDRQRWIERHHHRITVLEERKMWEFLGAV